MRGVEAQTEKVWSQASTYKIPKVVYINKLDQDGAAFGASVRSIASKLDAHPAVCQVPWWTGKEAKFCGVGDPIMLRAIQWPDTGDGSEFRVFSMDEIPPSAQFLRTEIIKARKALIDLLIEHDEDILNAYISAEEDALALSGDEIMQSLRKCLIDLKSNIVPVFAGASFRNIGVQTLLDAVVQLLPSPSEVPNPEVSFSGKQGTEKGYLSGQFVVQRDKRMNSSQASISSASPNNRIVLTNRFKACALAFKVVHDPHRGALVYVRVYSGTMRRQRALFNTNLQLSEKAPQLLKMYASESVQVDEIPAGQIGVITGLKHTRTGDTLISLVGASSKLGPPPPLNTLQLRPIEAPPTMFSSSVEPQTLSEQRSTQAALAILTREDPSLQVLEDEESGQTLLSGMGEFHLEIAKDRLINHHKAKASMGKLEIAYREAILQPSTAEVYNFEREQAGKLGKASCIASVKPLEEARERSEDAEHLYESLEEGNLVTISLRDSNAIPAHLSVPTVHHAMKNGALAALGRGINHGFQMRNTHVQLAIDPWKHLFGADSTLSAVSAAARLATKAALKQTALRSGSALLELIMKVTVNVDAASLGAVSNDLSSTRGGHILSYDEEGNTPPESANVNGLADPSPGTRPPIDPSKVYAPKDPFESTSSTTTMDGAEPPKEGVMGDRVINARVPLKEMIGYLKYLRSLTAGRGSFVMTPDRFEKVVGQREKALIRELRGY